MQKLGVGLLLAASLFFIATAPAAAHQGADGVRAYAHGDRIEARRRHDMPRWLERNRSFRHWYRRSPLRHYRRIGWSELFDIYRWERRYFGRRFHLAYGDDGQRRRGKGRR